MEPLLENIDSLETQLDNFGASSSQDAMKRDIRNTEGIKNLEAAALAREIAEIRLLKALKVSE